MSDLAIATRQLTKIYSRTEVVNNIDLRVEKGSVYGLVGRNGAGKTTLLKMLLGLVRPTAGSLNVLGMDYLHERLAILRRTAYVSESKALFDTMTGEDLVRFNRSYFSTWSDDAVRKYVKSLQVPMNRVFRNMSSGDKTKLCAVLALAQGADLIILDEPFQGLDPAARDELHRILIEDYIGGNCTILTSSHQLNELEQIADWIGIIDAGHLLLEGRLDDIKGNFRRIVASGTDLSHFRNQEVVGATPFEGLWQFVVRKDADEVAQQLRSNGAVVLEILSMSLQEIFLACIRKEELCTSPSAGETPASVSSRS